MVVSFDIAVFICLGFTSEVAKAENARNHKREEKNTAC